MPSIQQESSGDNAIQIGVLNAKGDVHAVTYALGHVTINITSLGPVARLREMMPAASHNLLDEILEHVDVTPRDLLQAIMWRTLIWRQGALTQQHDAQWTAALFLALSCLLPFYAFILNFAWHDAVGATHWALPWLTGAFVASVFGVLYGFWWPYLVARRVSRYLAGVAK